ncbi:MAG: Lrp/AsnC family transcriptional regulator [Thaumarchaeota archaeon]|nr:Lrp/AsnC family transcriptional regulator [Nitrososphaerota archaeon]
MVDERDFLILSQLRQRPFSSYETLGRGIGLSGKAVKTRIEAMERAKVLTSLQAMPAAQVFRRSPRLFFFKQPIASFDELHAAIEVDPAVFATADVNRSVAVLVYRDGPPRGPQRELGDILGPVESEVTPLFPYPRDELPKPLSVAELEVLRMLVVNLRSPIREISEATGLSQKVAKKARRRLLEEGLFQVQPILQSAQSSRILMYEVHVHSSDESVLLRIRQTLPKSVFINQWEHTAIILSCWADSIAEVFETERRLRSEPGVSAVRVKFHARAILSTARLTSWIDDEILRLREARKGP